MASLNQNYPNSKLFITQNYPKFKITEFKITEFKITKL